MAKIHLHDEQFDGRPHAWCGRADTAVTEGEFEATDPALRCRVCDREWFPHGQPDWHLQASRAALAEAAP